MTDLNGDNIFRDTEMFFTGGPGEESEEFAHMIGLEGTFWKWLSDNNHMDTINKELESVTISEEGLRSVCTAINDLADQAAIENHASRRIMITYNEDRELSIKLAVHPHTQRRIIEFMINHIKGCADKNCELTEDATEMLNEGYKILPAMVRSSIWTDSERLSIVGLLDQLEATISNGRR